MEMTDCQCGKNSTKSGVEGDQKRVVLLGIKTKKSRDRCRCTRSKEGVEESSGRR